jgi:hypothetical protein
VKLPDILGTFEFTGGTGKYMGIKGGGNFHVIMLSDAAQYMSFLRHPPPRICTSTPRYSSLFSVLPNTAIALPTDLIIVPI